MDDAVILSRVGLFSLMKKKDLRRIAKLAKHHSYKKGEIIVREGARDGRLFIIISGEVEVIKNLGAGDEKYLRVLRSDNYFGEMALIDDHVRTASVVAKEETEVLSLYQWNIREEIKKYPSIAIELLQTLGRRLRAVE
ncbi:MAG: cyclic nucleotide-binding domain-containing protein [Desulfobacteraceae bacterium]|uniref:Cyclic nucleotide-binding domain-containing protein n=1 Tax=Candidatus Desulfacyla euxinica TaxID=2841693 RepID=A0A8J6N1X5_9DELT|nr:cyclic nucleotide-binding domain-containing protein [Candidatus Desulfacyla euxinica]MBL6978545.1 cyclic nucleotide-binding domain-containing protein [Desulfobacteraceae bacterium]MBL7216442.1 cyclic nucleotide-binding domain-containing protein [Desulfobacteraceae bacterium]